MQNLSLRQHVFRFQIQPSIIRLSCRHRPHRRSVLTASHIKAPQSATHSPDTHWRAGCAKSGVRPQHSAGVTLQPSAAARSAPIIMCNVHHAFNADIFAYLTLFYLLFAANISWPSTRSTPRLASLPLRRHVRVHVFNVCFFVYFRLHSIHSFNFGSISSHIWCVCVCLCASFDFWVADGGPKSP